MILIRTWTGDLKVQERESHLFLHENVNFNNYNLYE